MPDTTWPIWLALIVMAIVIVGLCRLSRGFYWLAVPFAVLVAYNGMSFLIANVSVRNEMIQQLGFGYFVQFAISYAVPIISLAAYAWYDFKSPKRSVARFGVAIRHRRFDER